MRIPAKVWDPRTDELVEGELVVEKSDRNEIKLATIARDGEELAVVFADVVHAGIVAGAIIAEGA